LPLCVCLGEPSLDPQGHVDLSIEIIAVIDIPREDNMWKQDNYQEEKERCFSCCHDASFYEQAK
jgi:hypothetical protein